MRVARKYGIIAISSLVAVSCIPRKTYVSPVYDVAVAGGSGRALPNLKVRRFLEDYSIGTNADYSREAVTDSSGRTHFDADTHWISFARETYGCLSQILQTGSHASCGSDVDISVDAEHFVETGRREESAKRHGHAKSLTISLTPCPSGDWHTCAQVVARKVNSTSPGNR
jgi:hypothetical protein